MINLDKRMWQRLHKIQEFEYGYHCQKCNTWYEDLEELHPEGIFCPECKKKNYALVGVCYRERL